MDYLTLCQKTWESCALSGEGPGGVGSGNVMHQQVIRWVSDAWLFIQSMHLDWNFRTRREAGAPRLIVGQQEYTGADLGMTDFANLRKAWYLNPSSGNWSEVRVLHEPEDLANFWNAADGPPVTFLQDDTGHLLVRDNPDMDYSVRFKYTRLPQILAGGSDVPTAPEPYHWAIIWKAVEYYGLWDEDDRMVAKGSMNFEQTIRQMETTELPAWRFGKGELLHHARF